MQFQFSFKHMDTSEALQDYAQEKITAKIEKFVTKAIEVKVTFAVDRHLQRAACVLVSGDGFSVNVDHTCGDMYGSVDKLVDKLGAQLKKKKDRLKGHKNGSVRHLIPSTLEDEQTIDAEDIIRWEQARRNRAS